jgi:N6-L-threonylcarbamoyladenine synthase
VVPELASRRHIEAIVPVVREALSRAGTGLGAVDAVAATRGPGLIGSLLVGFSFAKALAAARGLPWVGVNHLEGHIHALFLDGPAPDFPFVALLASGGHTGLYHVRSHTHMELIGQTRDDAAGEAFDKVAKMLGLGYPGGVAVERLALEGNRRAIRFPRPAIDRAGFDFSFSGLKTAAGSRIAGCGEMDRATAADIAASFQEAVVDVLAAKLMRAAEACACPRAALVGGVAANQRLRAALAEEAGRRGVALFVPPLSYCGDNAAMVAAAGTHLIAAGRRGSLSDDVFSRAG